MSVELRTSISRKLGLLADAMARAANVDVWPAAMASPPTITAGSGNAASTINGAGITAPALVAADLTWLGTNPVQPTGAPTNSRAGASVNYGQAVRGSNLQSVQGLFSGVEFEIGWQRFTTPYCLWVNGVPVSASDLNSAGAGSANYYDKVTFAARGTWPIRIDFPGGTSARVSGAGGGSSDTLHGINFAGDATWAPLPRATPLKAMFVGDSWPEGTGKTRVAGSFAYGVARKLGLDDCMISAVGGTGIIQANTGMSPNRPNWMTRIADVTDFAPDVVIMSLSINDNGQTEADYNTYYGAYLAALQAALPQTIFLIIGPPNPSANFLSDARAGYMIAALQAVADATRTFIASSYLPAKPFSGTGAVGATTGTGNQDFYMGSDKAHPVQAGHDYYAAWAAAKLRQAVRAVL